jgi:predicted nucleic acid-binding protein
MVVFLDTSAVYALADDSDPNHEQARRAAQFAVEAGDRFLIHSYVLIESVALLARRVGWEPAGRFLEQANTFQVRWVDEALHRAAARRFIEHRGRFSLVDEVSFLVMHEAGVRHALAFDRHFRQEGFRAYPS